jgi:hypothetical protein
MAKHLVTPDLPEPGLLAGSEPSDFFKTVEGAFGSFMGPSIAENAERNLREWGIDSRKLRRMPQKGNNAIVFSLADKLVIKVNSELETYKQSPVETNPLVLEPFGKTNIGFDMGNVPIALEIFPQLNTKDVEPRHVRALCHDLYTKRGILFKDNKLDNVGLTREGMPYVIDGGSLVHVNGAVPRPDNFNCPDLSGYNQEQCSWETDVVNHGFAWPESQKNIFEFRGAATLMRQKSARAAIS